MYPIKHANNHPDYRYTITQEFCGYKNYKYILRFGTAWVDCFDTQEQARIAAIQHNIKRLETIK